MVLQSAKDILRLAGIQYSLRSAQRLYQSIRDAHQKQPHQLITTAELADYLGIPESEILPKTPAQHT